MALVALACGHLTLDRAGAGTVPGGAAYYAARTFAALGCSVRALAGAGPDFPPDALAGIDARLVPAARTTAFENVHVPGGRRVQRVAAVAPPLDPAALPAAWRGADIALLAPVVGEIDPAAFARAAGARVTGLGVQGLVRAVAPDGAVREAPWAHDPAALSDIDVAFLGEDDSADPDALAARLASTIPLVALTRGAAGSDVIAGGRRWRVGIHPAAAELDPTGAGDVYAAAFLVALARGASPAEAGRLGAAAASIAVEGLGAAALGRLGDAEERAARVPAVELRPRRGHSG